ncbi:hypothetical protein RB599_005182, partial [Gaeumannomyces hyphopodioides]
MGALRRSKCKWPLDALLVTTHAKFQASDQRDKVYGVLGLAAEWQDETAHPSALRPDYRLDVADVYQRATRFLLQKSSSLAMMAIARGTSGNLVEDQKLHELDLPSCTPDWSDFRLFKGVTKTPLCWVYYEDLARPARLGFPIQYAASHGEKPRLPKASGSSL